MMQEVKYDRLGRMVYHPEYHFNHGTPMTDEEKAYLCKFWDATGPVEMGLALGRTGKSLSSKISVWKKNGTFDYYVAYWDRMMERESI